MGGRAVSAAGNTLDFATCAECGDEFDPQAEGGVADCDALCGDCWDAAGPPATPIDT